MWILIVANFVSGRLDYYELPTQDQCERAVVMINSSTVKAWCVRSTELLAARGDAP